MCGTSLYFSGTWMRLGRYSLALHGTGYAIRRTRGMALQSTLEHRVRHIPVLSHFTGLVIGIYEDRLCAAHLTHEGEIGILELTALTTLPFQR